MMDHHVLLVPLRQKTVARLIACSLNERETLDGVVTRLAEPYRKELVAPATPTKPGRYRATLRGEPLTANFLREVLSDILNRLADMDRDFLHRLSSCQGRSRRHVAQNRDAIHPGRDDLNRRYTDEFRPGWWMGTNYSAADVRRILKAACRAAGLSIGRDLTIDF